MKKSVSAVPQPGFGPVPGCLRCEHFVALSAAAWRQAGAIAWLVADGQGSEHKVEFHGEGPDAI